MGINAKLMKTFKEFYKSEDGATAIEYGLIAALLAVAIIPGVNAFRSNTEDNFKCIENVIDGTETGNC